MKWFMTTNEASLNNVGFYRQMQVAVLSARERTTLEPYLVYDGNEHPGLEWLRRHGVTILPHRLTFADSVREYVRKEGDLALVPDLAEIRTGSFLKLEVPIAAETYGISDPYLFYTDCDVVFQRDPFFGRIRPMALAAHGVREGGWTRWRIGGWRHFNGGVLLLNREVMRSELPQLREFIMSNGAGVCRPPSKFMERNLFLSDQVTINVYFRGRITPLSSTYNWNPSRGIQRTAAIVHFNGLKWTDWDEFVRGALPERRMQQYSRLVGPHRAAYEHYVEKARGILRSGGM